MQGKYSQFSLYTNLLSAICKFTYLPGAGLQLPLLSVPLSSLTTIHRENSLRLALEYIQDYTEKHHLREPFFLQLWVSYQHRTDLSLKQNICQPYAVPGPTELSITIVIISPSVVVQR